MKKLLVCFAILVSLCSCSNRELMTIEGTIPEVYNGDKIYFCPLPSPLPEFSDSTVIENGKFEFVIPADSNYVAKLQIDNHAEDARYVQILYVGVEPGILNVDMGLVSSSYGTPTNDRLQQIKEYIDSLTSDREVGLFQRSELILAKIGDFVVDTPNGIGGYYNGKYGKFFPDSTKKRIDSLKLNRFIPDVSKRKGK